MKSLPGFNGFCRATHTCGDRSPRVDPEHRSTLCIMSRQLPVAAHSPEDFRVERWSRERGSNVFSGRSKSCTFFCFNGLS